MAMRIDPQLIPVGRPRLRLLPAEGATKTHEENHLAWHAYLESATNVPISRILYVSIAKRALDILIAGVALVFLCPVLMLAALMIRLDSPGPVIFRQQRVGRGGSPFTIYKFRTMRVDPVTEVRQFVTAEGTVRHKVRQDLRVTRVGRVLRKTSIDELPQLLNVLRGDMSLIGPRPELVQIVGSYQGWQHARHLVRPGITGWWQVSGRSDKPMHEHTELDLYYVEHLSPSLDVRILLRTVQVVLCGSGAF